jgi:hypothetical protein
VRFERLKAAMAAEGKALGEDYPDIIVVIVIGH